MLVHGISRINPEMRLVLNDSLNTTELMLLLVIFDNLKNFLIFEYNSNILEYIINEDKKIKKINFTQRVE